MKEYSAMLSNLESHNIPIKDSEFNEEAFGSWYIETQSEPVYRIVHDGRDKTIVLEVNNNNEWTSLMFDKTITGKYVIQRLVEELDVL